MKAIEIKNLTVSYKKLDNPLLKDVNFHLNYGEVALLSGFSGCGKSTVINLISGIIPNLIKANYVGEILVNNKLIEGKKVNEISKEVGIVMQNAELQIINELVEDEIAFGPENLGIPKEKIVSIVDKYTSELDLDKKDKTKSLSGGEKQKLITASSLAMGQKILILDEPLANLDNKTSHLLLSYLKELAKDEGYAILIVEHRIDQVHQYIDKFWYLKNKTITNLDTRECLKHNNIIQNKITTINTNTPLIKLNDMEISIDKELILKDINLLVNKSDRVLIIGDNGAGKTTLLNLIAKLIKPTRGNYEQFIFKKYNRKLGNDKWFSKVGYIFQNPNYQLFMPTVYKDINYNSKSAEITNKFIKELGLEHLKNRHPQSLSEGEKRRVSIAGVLAGMPEVLILDEPTVGQDYESLKNIVDVINNYYQDTNATIITITHDKRCALALADKAILIENKKIKEIGDTNLIKKYFKC
ncbi:MAG: ABC transporter ATP-binding protein [Acholeplasmataceae bacterium]